MDKGVERKWTADEVSRIGLPPVKSYEVWDGVISLAETCLLAKRQASFRWQELYPGSIMELENLHGYARQQRATSDGLVVVEGKRTMGSPQRR